MNHKLYTINSALDLFRQLFGISKIENSFHVSGAIQIFQYL